MKLVTPPWAEVNSLLNLDHFQYVLPLSVSRATNVLGPFVLARSYDVSVYLLFGPPKKQTRTGMASSMLGQRASRDLSNLGCLDAPVEANPAWGLNTYHYVVPG